VRWLDRTVPQPFWTHVQRGFPGVDYAGALRVIAVELASPGSVRLPKGAEGASKDAPSSFITNNTDILL
jgi:hypothetical protein